MVQFNSKLKHNNRSHGKYAWVAEISFDENGKIEREFLDRKTTYESTSKTTWYKYFWYLEPYKLYELGERNLSKNLRYFFYVDENGEEHEVSDPYEYWEKQEEV